MTLIAAGTAARRRALAGQAWALASEVDWPMMADVLAARRLLATLGPRICALSGESCDGGFEGSVAVALEQGRRQGTLLAMTSARATQALAAAGIQAAPLKGPALAEALYGDLGRRPSADVDLLVAAEDLDDAAGALGEALGYGEPHDPRDADGLPTLHLALATEAEDLPPVELHWRVHWYERRFARERLLPPSPGAARGWRCAPADQLAALLLFYARDGFGDLRLATDIGAWWDAFGDQVAEGALAGTIDDYPALRHAIGVSATVARDLVGLPADALLGGSFRPRRRDRLAVQLANPNPEGTTLPQHYADRGLLDGLLAPRGGLGEFVHRQLWPSDAVLEQQADHAGRGRARRRAARCLGVLGRYIARLAAPPRREEAIAVAGREGGRRVRIMGLAVGRVREEDVVAEILAAVEDGRGHWTVTANLDHLRRHRAEPLARELLGAADLVIPDGMPLVWASRVAGTPLPERITGSNLIPPLCAAAARRGIGVVLLGGDEGTAERAAQTLSRRHPGLEVLDTICPPFGFEHDEEQLGQIEARIARRSPTLIFVGLGFPKQDLIIRRLREVAPGAGFVGIGRAFSFFSGDLPRAPSWARDHGLEWLHRLAHERHLAHRYLVLGLPFALRLLASAGAHRLGSRQLPALWGDSARGEVAERPADAQPVP